VGKAAPAADGMSPHPRALTIAGSDSGGGAGIQADLKTFAAHGAYGMSVITALTAQNTREVRAVLEVPPEMVAAQIDAVLEDIGADAVKIGMLASAPLIQTVAARLRAHLAGTGVPIVLDPVMVAKSGDRLLRADAVAALKAELLPIATLITPNLPELETLTDLPVGTEDERLRAAAALAALGPAVLAKGGHEVIGEGANGIDAVNQYQALRPDIMTLDITMPEKDGLAALKEILNQEPTARVVMCSALGQEAKLLEAIKAAAQDFVVKPFQHDQVLEAIGKALS